MRFEDKRNPAAKAELEKGAIVVLTSGQKLLIAVDNCNDVQLVDVETNIVVEDTCIDIHNTGHLEEKIEDNYADIAEVIPASVVKVVAE